MSKEINMDDLGDVSGGTGGGGNCWFEPTSPLTMTGEGDRRRVQCKSLCNPRCSCYGTHLCENRFHLIENAPEGARELWAFPRGQNNHSDPRKRILPT